VTETDLQAAITGLCDGLEPPLVWLHIADARRREAGGPWRQGFPDLLIVGQHRALFRELKGDGGELHARQNAWLSWLCQVGLDADLWTPRDLRNGTILDQLEALHQPRPGQLPDTADDARLRTLYLPRITAAE
jgi:hypothetical protein